MNWLSTIYQFHHCQNEPSIVFCKFLDCCYCRLRLVLYEPWASNFFFLDGSISKFVSWDGEWREVGIDCCRIALFRFLSSWWRRLANSGWSQWQCVSRCGRWPHPAAPLATNVTCLSRGERGGCRADAREGGGSLRLSLLAEASVTQGASGKQDRASGASAQQLPTHLAGDARGVALGSLAAHALTTTDGGEAWESVSLDQPLSSRGSCHPSFFPLSLNQTLSTTQEKS